MRPQLKWIWSAVLVVLILSPVFGQLPPGARIEAFLEIGVDAPILLSNDAVKREIHLSDAQANRFKQVVKQGFDKYRPNLRDAKGDQEKQRQFLREWMLGIRQHVRKALPDILKPEQIKRLDQIQIQANGILSFKRKDVQDHLQLSIKQKLEILKIGNELKKEVTKLFNDAVDMPLRKMPAAFQKSKELKSEATQKALDTLSSEQKDKWKEMTGNKFDYKFDLPIGRGRRKNN